MCLATFVETRKGPVHQQCVLELYAIVTFVGGFQPENIYWCPYCGKISGGTQTPKQLFKEWRDKGIKFKITKIAET